MADTQPEPLAAVRRQARLFALLLLALVIVAQLPLPFRLAGLAFGLAATWVAGRTLVAMSRLRRSGTPARGNIAVAAGLGLTGVLTAGLIWEAAWYPLAAEQERCLSGANTRTARALCEQQAQDRIADLVERLTGTRPPSNR